jgi:hypothetical protein
MARVDLSTKEIAKEEYHDRCLEGCRRGLWYGLESIFEEYAWNSTNKINQ